MSGAPARAVLVVAPGWVGDLVMSQSLLATLRRRDPDAVLDVLAPEWSLPLIARMPEPTSTLALSIGHGELRPMVRWRLARTVRRRRYDQAIVTRRSLKAALIPFLAGIPQRTGVRGESRWWLINDVRRITSETHAAAAVRFAVLGMEPGAAPELDEIPWPSLRTDQARGQALEDRLRLSGAGGAVGLAPGAAYGPAKRWPLERWAELARGLAGAGRRVWVFGSAAERAEGDVVAAGVPTAANLCGRTSLEDVVDLMARCEAVVSNDSGLMHVAAAAGTRVVALFGSTSPLNTPPLSADARVIWRALACSPCFQRHCPLGHLHCLREITVAEVLGAALGGPSKGPGDA